MSINYLEVFRTEDDDDPTTAVFTEKSASELDGIIEFLDSMPSTSSETREAYINHKVGWVAIDSANQAYCDWGIDGSRLVKNKLIEGMHPELVEAFNYTFDSITESNAQRDVEKA